jgi:galactokinase
MNDKKLIEVIKSDALDKTLKNLYVNDIDSQKARYCKLVENFTLFFGEQENLEIFSAPGRTEIGGNHTDHNHGRVLAGSVNLDIIGVVSKNYSNLVRIKSQGYEVDVVDLNNLEIDDKEENKSIALIRGILARFVELGYKIGGFDCYTTSNVLKGSGLSSSAAFEVLVATILSYVYNNKQVNEVEIAQISQYAENVYFKKPSGLMDQMASSVGGIISIDFEDTKNPIINKVNFDFANSGYALCIVDTGGNHADLTFEYSAIPMEMKSVAQRLGQTFLRQVDLAMIMKNLPMLRDEVGDRAVLRAIHFLRDNERVLKQVDALNNNDFEEFKRLVIESGDSSYKYLQNVYTTINISEQGLSLALCIAEDILCNKGAYRVHGGGFGGTIQNFVPLDMLDEFKQRIEEVFGEGSCYILSIRPVGGTKII